VRRLKQLTKLNGGNTDASEAVDKIDTLAAKGLVASTRLDEALSSRLDSATQFAVLTGESRLLKGNLHAIKISQVRAAEALSKLEEFYMTMVRSEPVGTLLSDPTSPFLARL
jgi:hypothetical protein